MVRRAPLRKLRLRYLVFLIGLAMVISGITINWGIQTDFGQVTTSEIYIITDDETRISGILQVPHSASPSHPVPGILVVHGFGGSKELMISFGIELARRDFIVLTIDAEGHGNSDPGSTSEGVDAVEFLLDMPEVEGIGVIGHSMGAGIILEAVRDPSLDVNATVLIGGGPSGSSLTWMNTSIPRNLLVAVGFYDELYDIPSFTSTLSGLFGTSNPVEANQLYGIFNDGSARKLITPPSNHLFEPADPFLVSATVDWLQQSFNHSESLVLPPTSLLYLFHYICGGLASVGLVITVFPIFMVLLDRPSFQSMKSENRSTYLITRRKRWQWGIVYSIIGLGSFIPFVVASNVIPFPQSFGASFGLWLLGSGLIAIVILDRLRKRDTGDITWHDFGGFSGDFQKTKQGILKGVIIAGILFLWLYTWTGIIDTVLALDFRAFFPIFNDLTLARFLMVPVYVLLITPFFYVEGLWLVGYLRSRTPGPTTSDQIKWVLEASMLKVLPYLILTIIQYGPAPLLGTVLFKGSIGFLLLFLLPFSPMFIFTTCLIGWSYLRTGKIFTGAFTAALILSWILASILPLVV